MVNIDLVKRSFDRCSAQGGLIDAFYDTFLDSHPDIAPRFAHTNFEHQKKLLLQGLDLTIMFATNEPMGKIGINRIKKSHCKANLNITPELYPFWKTSLLQVLALTDPEFSEEIREQWDWVLQNSIDYIISGYDG